MWPIIFLVLSLLVLAVPKTQQDLKWALGILGNFLEFVVRQLLSFACICVASFVIVI